MTPENLQRREPTPYIRFCSIVRPALRELNPDMSLAEMETEMGIIWSAIPEQNHFHVVNNLTPEIFRMVYQYVFQ